ncbi:beta-galactoside-binding lectin-like [Rhinoraja longicauda]
MAETNKLQNLMMLTGFQIKSGGSIEVEGRIKYTTIRFAIDLGKGPGNIAMHFNPRLSNDDSRIVINNMVNSRWKTEQIEKCPIRNNEDFKILIKFNGDNFEIVLSNDATIKFPNRSGMDTLETLSINGDIQLKSVKCNN